MLYSPSSGIGGLKNRKQFLETCSTIRESNELTVTTWNIAAINNNPFELNNLKNILLPNTMGELFKALILSKNINQDLLSIKEFNQLEKL